MTAALIGLGVLAPGFSRAQIAPPEFKAVNPQHVNLLTATDFNLQAPTVDITEPLLSMAGPDLNTEFTRYLPKVGNWRDTYQYAIDASNIASIFIILGDETHIFSTMYPSPVINGITYIGDSQGNALNVITVSGNPYWQYIGRNGTIVLFDANLNLATSVSFPSGLARTYYYKTDSSSGPYPVSRIQSIVQNDGTMIKYAYGSDTAGTGEWSRVASVSLINQAYTYCDPNADHCSITATDWPTASFVGPPGGVAPSGQTVIETTTTSAGYGKSYKKDMYGRVLGISNGSPYSESLSYSYVGTTYKLSQVNNNTGDIRLYTATSPDFTNYTLTIGSSFIVGNETYLFNTNTSGSMPTQYTDRNGKSTFYTWSVPDGHPLTVKHPEGNSESYQYDGRFNITSKTTSPKAGTTGSLVEHASFDATCTNINICNQPTSYTDAKGGETKLSYTSFGKKASEMGPPPTPGGARRLKLYSYSQMSANVLNAGGALVTTAQPIWLLSGETDCQTVAGSTVATCDPGAPQNRYHISLRRQRITR